MNKFDLKKYEIPIFLILINIVFLFAFESSPIYNYSIYETDSGIYQNIAKEMLNGKVLYKDLFDIKGPFIFFLYLIPSIIGTNLGVYIIDVLIYSMSCFLMYKTMGKNNLSIFERLIYFLIILSCITITYVPLIPESIMFLTISYINYWVTTKKYLNPTNLELIFCGILTGLIFWLKFSMGTFIAVIYLYFLLKNKKIKNIVYPAVGMLLPTVIVLGYFIYHNALADMFNTYFITSTKYSIKSLEAYELAIILGFMLVIAVFLFINLKRKNKENILLLISYEIFVISSFILTKHHFLYYYIPFISIFSIVSVSIKKYKSMIAPVLSMFLCSLLAFNIINIFNIKKEQEVYRQFAEDVNYEVESISGLFIMATHIQGYLDNINYKYFFFPSLPHVSAPELWDTVREDITNKKIEYVVIRVDENNSLQVIDDLLVSMDKIEEIMNIMYENYEVFNTYGDFIVLKRIPQDIAKTQ